MHLLSVLEGSSELGYARETSGRPINKPAKFCQHPHHVRCAIRALPYTLQYGLRPRLDFAFPLRGGGCLQKHAGSQGCACIFRGRKSCHFDTHVDKHAGYFSAAFRVGNDSAFSSEPCWGTASEKKEGGEKTNCRRRFSLDFNEQAGKLYFSPHRFGDYIYVRTYRVKFDRAAGVSGL